MKSSDAIRQAKLLGKKQCSQCGDAKPLTCFARYKRAVDGRQVWCRACTCRYDRMRHVEREPQRIPDLLREQWQPLPGYEALYAASNLGRVKRLAGFGARDEKLLRPITRGNRTVVNLWRDGKSRQKPVHRIVYAAWRGPIPDGWEIHHLNGDWSVNATWNLLALPKKLHLRWHRGGGHEGAVRWIEECTSLGYDLANLRSELRCFDG